MILRRMIDQESERGGRIFVRSAFVLTMLLGISLIVNPRGATADAAPNLDQKMSSRDTSFYRDFFDSVAYESVAEMLRFDHLWDTITFKKHAALDVNIFDEVPDSGFFVNRHGKERMSGEALKRGPVTGSGPNPNGPWRILKGKVEGVSPGFFIEDGAGVRYLLKFDPKDNPEMATSAEIISHKFFHAMGYHVPEYYLVDFKPAIMTIDPKATYYDEDGFKKKLTQDAFWDLIGRVPKRKGGIVRASASKMLQNHRGYMDFDGRRKSDPEDLIRHEDRRSIRALRVLGSWLNHYDLRKGNTLDVIETEGGRSVVKHYLIDFGSTLGSAGDHPKVPVAGYEHIVDWYEIGGAIPTMKVMEKSWEKRWDELNRTIAYPSLGYFDNYHFDPKEWKTQLHYEAFDRLTAADAFWATKILLSFTNEDIRGVVGTAKLSNEGDADVLSEILIARRDIVARYWLSQVTPLDGIQLFHVSGDSYEVTFTDLVVDNGLAGAGETAYRYRVKLIDEKGKKQKSSYLETSSPSLSFEASGLSSGGRAVLYVQSKHGAGDGWSNPSLKLVLAPTNQDSYLHLVEIDHGV